MTVAAVGTETLGRARDPGLERRLTNDCPVQGSQTPWLT